MKFDSLPRVMALCVVMWGIPMAAFLLVMDYRQGVLDPNLGTTIVLTALVGGAFVGAAIWFTIGRYLVDAKRRQAEARKANAECSDK